MNTESDILADCMECDDEIEEDCKVCPGCGLEAPVAYRWYREKLEPAIIKAREGDDPLLLANLLFDAWYDAGSLPDPYVMGDMYRELVEVYKENQMYGRLIWQYCQHYTNYNLGDLQAAEDALNILKEIDREDLEWYVYQEIKRFNHATTKRQEPENTSSRIEELGAKVASGELTPIEFPHLDKDMWK